MAAMVPDMVQESKHILYRELLSWRAPVIFLLCIFFIFTSPIYKTMGCRAATLLAPSSSLPRQSNFISQEIRYRAAGAGEVFLVWGVNNWRVLPKAQQPAGTEIKNSLMTTPMRIADGVFTATVQAPKGATIDYVFQISKTSGGEAVDIWDTNGTAKQDYHTVVNAGGAVELDAPPEILSKLAPVKNKSFSTLASFVLFLGSCFLAGVFIVYKRIAESRADRG